MRLLIGLTLIFIACNLAWVWVHIQAFQSNTPILVVLTLLVHAGVLIALPYKTIINALVDDEPTSHEKPTE